MWRGLFNRPLFCLDNFFTRIHVLILKTCLLSISPCIWRHVKLNIVSFFSFHYLYQKHGFYYSLCLNRTVSYAWFVLNPFPHSYCIWHMVCSMFHSCCIWCMVSTTPYSSIELYLTHGLFYASFLLYLTHGKY